MEKNFAPVGIKSPLAPTRLLRVQRNSMFRALPNPTWGNDMTSISGRSLLCALMLSGSMIAGVAMAPLAHAQAEAERSYDIPAGGLGDALNRFADQGDVQLSYEADLVSRQRSEGLQGRFSQAQALSRLLSGTGLVARRLESGALTIVKATTGSMTLDEVEVRGMVQPASAEEEAALERRRQDGKAATIVVLGATVGSDKRPSSGPWGAKAILDTPYSINVTSSDLIETVIAGDMDQIYKMNPVVQNSAPSTVYGTPYAAIRGFHTQSGVMDGLRLSSTSTGIAMEELERVEVMNGLSGFMYGVGNPGGVTNYVLKRPTYEQTARLAVGNYGGQQWFGHVDLGNRIDKDGILAYRLNISHQNGETSKQDQNVRRTLFSGAIDWNVSPNLLLQVEGAHTFYRLDGIDSRFYAYANSSFGALDYWIKPLANDKTYTPPWTYLQIKTDRVGGNAKWTLNDIFSVRAAYLYKRDVSSSINIYPAYFADSGYKNGWPSISTPSYATSQGAYAYLDSAFQTGGIKHKLTVGISGDTLRNVRHVVGSVSASNSPAYTDPDDLMSWAMPDAFRNVDAGGKYRSAFSRNMNVIVGDDISFTDQLSALVGFNYTSILTRNYNADGSVSSGYDKKTVTPTVSLIFKPAARLTAYASYMQGLEKGTAIPDDPTYAQPGKILKPFISKQYEVGTKYALSDAFLLTAALYRIEKANSYQDVNSEGKFTINQDGLEIHQGLELTATGQLTPHLNLVIGGSLMDISVKKATNAALKGKEPTGVAEKLAKIYLDYKVPGLTGFSLSGGAFYSGSMYKDAANLQRIDGYVVFDLGAHYKTEFDGHPVRFDLNVANLTDKDYWATSYSLGIPRNVAFSVRWGI